MSTEALLNLFKKFYRNKKILVTGGCGFIGSHLTFELIKLGARVYVIDDLSTGKLESLQAQLHKIVLFREDLKNKLPIENILKQQFPVIFHLAAIPSVPLGEKNPSLCWETNVTAFANLLDELIRTNQSPNVVLASSSAVYGQVNNASSEYDELFPTSNYAKSKLEGELLLKNYAAKTNGHSFALRYFNVFGDNEPKSVELASVFAKFKKAFYEQQPINIFGSGNQLRDYVSVSKVVMSNLLMPILPRLRNLPLFSIFNVASGKSITLFELLEQIRKEIGLPIPQLCFSEPRSGDVLNSIANSQKLDSILDFYSKEESITL